MAKSLKLLLTENVDSVGIVGDVVNVRVGFARNFLLPRDLATQPSEEKVKALASKRAEAERMLAEQRKQREATIGKLQGYELSLTRSCNDQGILYGAITQQDVATALGEAGFAVKPRDVRIAQVIKRIDTYDLHIKMEADLDATIKLWVVADRKLDLDKAAESAGAAEAKPEAGTEAPADAEAKPAKAGKGEKAAGEPKAEKSEAKAEKPAKKEKAPKSKDDAKSEEKASGSKSGWGKPAEDAIAAAFAKDFSKTRDRGRRDR